MNDTLVSADNSYYKLLFIIIMSVIELLFIIILTAKQTENLNNPQNLYIKL